MPVGTVERFWDTGTARVQGKWLCGFGKEHVTQMPHARSAPAVVRDHRNRLSVVGGEQP
jgi:hypothetical protein